MLGKRYERSGAKLNRGGSRWSRQRCHRRRDAIHRPGEGSGTAPSRSPGRSAARPGAGQCPGAGAQSPPARRRRCRRIRRGRTQLDRRHRGCARPWARCSPDVEMDGPGFLVGSDADVQVLLGMIALQDPLDCRAVFYFGTVAGGCTDQVSQGSSPLLGMKKGGSLPAKPVPPQGPANAAGTGPGEAHSPARGRPTTGHRRRARPDWRGR